MAEPRAYNCEEVTAYVMASVAMNGFEEAAQKLKRRIEAAGKGEAVRIALSLMTGIITELGSMNGDENQRIALERRAAVTRVSVGYVDKPPRDIICLDERDASTLCGHALNYCELECPCVMVDETTGERSVIVEAVRGCELANVYKRLMVSANGLSAECPYALLPNARQGEEPQCLKAGPLKPVCKHGKGKRRRGR